MKELGLLTQKEYENQFRVYNAAAFSNPANYGIEKTITTLTQIIADVQRQKFYTVAEPLNSYVPIELGTGAYARQIFQYAVAQVGDNFEAGIVQPGNGINKDANLDITVDGITLRNNFWRMKYQATKEILETARVNAQTFSYIEEQQQIDGCKFNPRCDYCMNICKKEMCLLFKRELKFPRSTSIKLTI